MFLNPPGSHRRAWNAASIFLVLALSLLLTVPWLPGQFPLFIDPSDLRIDLTGLIVMSHSFAAGKGFGTEILFPYGPYQFLLHPLYWPGRFPYLLIGRIAVAVALALGFCRLLRSVGLATPLTGFILAIDLGLLSLTHTDAFFNIIGPLLLYLHFISDRERTHPTTLLVSAVAALVGFIKFPMFVVVVFVIALTAVVDLFIRRRPPLVGVTWLCAVVFWWLVAGQSLQTLPAWIFTSYEIGAGFTDAMSLGYADRDRLYEVAVFVLSGAVLGAVHLFALRDRFRSNVENVLACAGIALFIYVVFKHGVVRHDAHAQQAAIGLIALALTLLALINYRYARLGWTSAAALCAMIAVNGEIYYSYAHAQNPLRLFSALRNGWIGIRELPWTQSRLEAQYLAGLTAFRQNARLPVLQGTVDHWPDNGALPALAGYDYRPRPMFTPFSVYSRAIGERNVAFLEGPQAPDHMLFEVATIDDRLATMDDPLSWKSLLRHYEVASFTQGGVLVLDRRKTPRTLSLVPFLDKTIGWNEALALQAEPARLIWAEIDTKKSLLGGLLAFAYKPPEVWIEVGLRNGRQQRFRVVPANAKLGFLLSPIIQDVADGLQLFGQLDDAQKRAQEVVSVRLQLEPPLNIAYKKDIGLRLSYLDLDPRPQPKLEDGAIQRIRRLAELKASIANPNPILLNFRSVPNVVSPVLFAHAPTSLALDIDQRAAELSFGFGMLPSADAGLVGDGVVFRILGEATAGEQKDVLYEKRLDPAHIAGERGHHTGRTSFAAGKYRRLIFETNPGPAGNSAYDHSYWSDVTLH